MSDNTLKVSLYPGCSLAATGLDYAESIKTMCRLLGVELVELKGWTCCGASSGSVLLSHEAATALPTLVLKLAAADGLPVFAPCAACYNRLKVALRDLKAEPKLAEKLEVGPEVLNLKILNSVDLLRDVVGLDRLQAAVKTPLTGMNIAAYYGCLLLRPKDMDTYDDPEQPTSMEDVIAAVGATPVDWSGRSDCCGASIAGTNQKVAESLVTRIIALARYAGADAALTACQLCHVNLESRQADKSVKPMPILYISDLVGLALGATSGELGMARHLIDVAPALAVKQTAAAEH